MNRRFVVAMFAAALLSLPFAAGSAGAGGATQADLAPAAAPVPPPGAYVFQGCWAYFASGPCYDIYKDAAGDYWICLKCGTTKKPGPAQCKRITAEQLSRGYWCS